MRSYAIEALTMIRGEPALGSGDVVASVPVDSWVNLSSLSVHGPAGHAMCDVLLMGIIVLDGLTDPAAPATTR